MSKYLFFYNIHYGYAFKNFVFIMAYPVKWKLAHLAFNFNKILVTNTLSRLLLSFMVWFSQIYHCDSFKVTGYFRNINMIY